MSDRAPVMTGGCQCGAVRYALHATPHDPHVCHCRMCQKAFGGPFAPLASVRLEDLEWTRGRPASFMSSALGQRSFCRDCGTPLSVRDTDMGHISIALGSLDDPSAVAPERAYGIESKVAWVDRLSGLPATTTEADIPAERMAQLRSRQHPDHDTETWPPR
jgi:hypothetical protein